MGGKSSKNKITKHDQAVLDLKVQRDKLTQYHKKCTVIIEKEQNMAKELLAAGKKKQALLALKKKRYQENLLDKSQAQLDNVQTLIDSVETIQMQQKIFDALKEGNESLKALQAEIGGIDAVDNLMLDTEEALAAQTEIDLALGGALRDMDEDEMERELAQLMSEADADGAAALAAAAPSVPTDALPAQGAAKGEGTAAAENEDEAKKEPVLA